MVITPAALELVLLWPFSLGGDDDRPWTAESTLVRGSDMMGYCGINREIRELDGKCETGTNAREQQMDCCLPVDGWKMVCEEDVME